MEKHEYTVTITANDKTEATEKVKALVTLAGKLTVKELQKLADVVKNNPVQTAMAKKFLGI